jgi:hypothetical protein
MLAVMAVMLPGVAAAVAVGFAVKDIGPLLAMGVLALWELLAALGCFALARGILHRCDMLTLKLEK